MEFLSGNFFRHDDIYSRILFNIPFTNNGAEGFNSSLNREMSNAHPSIVELLKFLRDREHINTISMYQTISLSRRQLISPENKQRIFVLLQGMKNGDYLKILKRICGLYNFKDSILD